MRPPLLQFPDATANPGEAAVGCRLPLACQVARRTQRQMHTFVEVVAGFPVPPDDFLGHDGLQEIARLVAKGLIVVGEFDSGEELQPLRPF